MIRRLIIASLILLTAQLSVRVSAVPIYDDGDDLLTYVSSHERVTGPDRTSASSVPVGSPQGAFAVSPTGAATYTVPIAVPKGINGMEPSLSLVYNSQSGNGIAGYGFSIGGLSAITRVPCDLRHDAIARGINYSSNDALALDGRRLILKSGVQGQAGSKYTIEGDPFTEVEISQYGGTDVVTFTVSGRDGLTKRYGLGTSQAYVQKAGVSNTYAWYLNDITDASGNSIVYDYIRNNGTTYLSSVVYHGNQVNFTYEDRPDTIRYNVFGEDCNTSKRLKEIITGTPVETFRKYSLDYVSDGDTISQPYSRLTIVTEQNGTGETLNPIAIEWEYIPQFGYTAYTPSILPASSVSNLHIQDKSYLSADMTGDGIDDIVQVSNVLENYYNTGSSTGGSPCTYVYIYPSSMNSDAKVSFGTPYLFRGVSNQVSAGFKNSISGSSFADFDGDGLADICTTRSDGNGDNGVVNFYTYVLLGSERGYDEVFSGISGITLQHSSETPAFTICDFDNDGRSEIVVLENGLTNGKYRIHYLYNNHDYGYCGNYYFNEKVESLSISATPRQISAGDLNGDGLNDIIVFHDNGYTTFFNGGVAHNAVPFPFTDNLGQYVTVTNSYMTGEMHIRQGDFNGDGAVDFLVNKKEDHNFFLLTGNGNGTFAFSNLGEIGLYEQTTYNDDDRFQIIPTDFDHDGRTDLVLGKAVYVHHGGITGSNDYDHTDFLWLRSDGNAFTQVRSFTTYGEDDAKDGNVLLGNFTGIGVAELMNFGNSLVRNTSSWTHDTGNEMEVSENELTNVNINEINIVVPDIVFQDSIGVSSPLSMGNSGDESFHVYSFKNLSASSGRVTGITDGMGNNTSITYKPLTAYGVYSKTRDVGYPLTSVCLPVSVVTNVTADNGAAIPIGTGSSQGTATTSYSYGGMMLHTAGAGFAGFADCTQYDAETRTTTVTKLNNWDSQQALPTANIIKHTTGNSYADSTMVVSAIYASGNNYWTAPVSTTQTDIYGNVTTTTRSYDTAKGVPTQERTEYGSQNMYRQTDYSGYVQKNDMWLPQTITATQKHSDDATTFSVTTQIAYDENGRQTSVTENAQSDLALTTAYSYDSYGNVSSKTVSGEGVDSLRTVYIYQNGRDLSEQYTIPASAHSTYTYDTWGNVLTSTDVTDTSNPLTTTYTYDGWGRTLTATDPTGAVTSTSRGWGTTQAKKYWTIEERPSSPWVKTWYDSRGREVLTESVGEDCIQLSKETSYDSAGRKIRERHTTGRLTMDDTYFYDDLGRIATINTRSGETTYYTYGNRTVTTTMANRTYSKTMDAWGNVKTSSDPVSNVTYTYGPSGNPVVVTAAGSTVSLSYDDCGNRTSVSDPDAGTVTTEYDALGRVTRQTDARGKVTVNTYDALGRLTETVCDGTATTYTYGTEGGAAMQLTRQQTGSFAAAYTYDSYGRLIAETRTIESPLVFGYTYDTNGNIASRTYPGNVQVDYTYDINGYKTQAKIGNRNVWRLDGYDGLTRVTAVTDGCLQHAERQDIFGRTESVTTWRGTNLADSMTFAYNQYTGNLTSRTGMQSSTETFTYDNLDRLTGVSEGGVQQSAITYETNGNIYSKTGIGNYTYDTTKPHAVTEVENTAECIDTLCQTVIYNGFGRISHIDNTEFKMTFNYGPDRERWKTVIEEMPNASPFPGIDSLWTGPIGGDGLNGGGGMAFPIRTKGKILYARDYEYYEPMASGNTHRYYYLDGGVLYHKESRENRDELLFMQADNLGSIRRIYGKAGATVFEATYDAWGLRTVIKDSIDFRRGYTGHEHLAEFGLINMNGRLYDPLLGRFLSPDPYVQLPDFSQNYNRYSYCLNNPLKYTDPSGELVWWIPVVAGAIIGAYTGASIQSGTAAFWNWKRNFWKGAIVGSIIGATIGYGFSSAMAVAPNSSITGMIKSINGIATITKSAGITGSIIHSGIASMAVSSVLGGDLDEVWKSGITGLITGAWAITGGLGMVKGFGSSSKIARLAGKLGYQMIGTVGQSIGTNWAKRRKLFSKVTLGVGPVNLTFGKGQRLLQLKDNIGNIISNSLGLANTFFGGKVYFDWENLTPVYYGGLRDIFFPSGTAIGTHAIIGDINIKDDLETYTHELHHLWQSRAMINQFIPTYIFQGLNAIAMGGNFVDYFNYLEQLSYGHEWFGQ